jgi:hypothetical protein
MKRLLVFLAFLAGLAVALAVVRSEVSTDAVSAKIAGVLVPFGDRKPDFRADVTVRLFPRLAVVFNSVRIAATSDATLDRPDLTADRIIANIDILPLLIGQTSVDRFVLEHPFLRIRTTFDLDGLTPARTLLQRMLPASVVVHGGEIRIETPDGTREETLQSVEADLRWPRALGNLSLDGSATWRGERIALSLQGIAPPRLAAGEPGDLDVTLSAPSLRASFAGQALLSDRLQLDGIFSAGADDPQRLADLLAGKRLDQAAAAADTVGSFPRTELSGHLRSQGWMAALSEAELKIGTVMANGVLSARFDVPRPQLRGTLAIGDVDLTAARDAIKAQHWLDWAPDPMAIAGLDVDLRLSVNNLVVGSTHLANLASSLLIAEGQIHAEVGDVSLLGGQGSILLHGEVDQAGIKTGGRFTLVGAPLTALRALLSLDALPAASGATSLIGDFTTAGRTFAALWSGVRGRANLEAQRLTLDGAAAPALGLTSARSPLLKAAGLQLRLNPEIERLLCTTTFTATDLSVQRLDFLLAGLKFALKGSASFAKRTLDLTGSARRDPATPTEGSPSSEGDHVRTLVPIRVTGSFDLPLIMFDPEVPDAAPDPSATGGVDSPSKPPN